MKNKTTKSIKMTIVNPNAAGIPARRTRLWQAGMLVVDPISWLLVKDLKMCESLEYFRRTSKSWSIT